MHRRIVSPDPHIYDYVRGILKGSCTLGEAATQARQFENELNAWMDEVEKKGGEM